MLIASHQPGEIWMIVVQMASGLKIPAQTDAHLG